MPHHWAIILAGGEGERLRPLIERWLGRHTPKQYCAFVGTRSMLQHTVDRAGRLVGAERLLTVIARSHLVTASSEVAKHRLGTVLAQPSNRDTLPGIFYPLSYVRARDPHATVVVLPSDHFVYPEARFIHQLRRAIHAARHLPDRLTLLGVEPSSAESDYGWIEPGREIATIDGTRVRGVNAFLEKPGETGARSAFRAGALWNTLILVARAETLWRWGAMVCPEVLGLLARLYAAIDTPAESRVLDSIYRWMPPRNVSSQLLQKIPEHIALVELRGVHWCDWGRPERIVESLQRIGKAPSFPLRCLANEAERDVQTEAPAK